jgi:outer membrane protein TolC
MRSDLRTFPIVRRLAVSAGVAALAAAAWGVGADTALDIETAIGLALEQNQSLVASALSVRRRALDVRAAGHAFDFRVRPSGRLDLRDSDADWQYGMRADKKLIWGTEIGVSGDVRRYPSIVDDDWRSAVRVEFRQPLFRDFGRLVHGESLTAAGEHLLAERRRWEQQKADLVMDVVRVFETIVRLEKQIETDKTVLGRLEKLCALTRARERQGRATRVDSLRAELQRGQAVSRLENHRETLLTARRELAELLGLPPGADFEVVPPPLPDLEVPDAEEAVATALRNRMDYAQALENVRTGKRAVRLAKREQLPELSLLAWHERYGEDDGFSDSAGLDGDDWFFGLSAEVEMNRARERTAVEQAETDVGMYRQSAYVKARAIGLEVQQAISAYRRARTELEISGRNVELAEARAELARRLFEMGRGDSFGATDAQDATIEAQMQWLAARSDASVAGYRLLRSLGTLIEYPPELRPPSVEATP